MVRLKGGAIFCYFGGSSATPSNITITLYSASPDALHGFCCSACVLAVEYVKIHGGDGGEKYEVNTQPMRRGVSGGEKKGHLKKSAKNKIKKGIKLNPPVLLSLC